MILLCVFSRSTARETDPAPASARIVGTVVDLRGQPLKNIFVHAFLEQIRMYVATVNSSATGEFVIPKLEPGTYEIFGESDAAGYPDTALSFYSNEHPVKVTLARGVTAKVVLIVGPKAGVLSGIVADKVTGKPIVSRHALRFIVRRISDPTSGIEFDGPPKFRWLIPPATEVTLEVRAECYETLVYADPARVDKATVVLLKPGEEKTLNVQLQPVTKCR